MLEELKKAEKYIFMEYFIIEEGYMWGKILEILMEKAKQGVDVRVMYSTSFEKEQNGADSRNGYLYQNDQSGNNKIPQFKMGNRFI